MATYTATINHDDDGDFSVRVTDVGYSTSDRASIAWALRRAAELLERGDIQVIKGEGALLC